MLSNKNNPRPQSSCVGCGNTTTNPKFCSQSCAASYNNTKRPSKIKRKCNHCDNLVRYTGSQLCLKHSEELNQFKYEGRRKLTLKEYWNKKSLENLHRSSKNVHVRALARNQHKALLKLPCHQCGYSKHVELCHIKPISQFSEDALIEEVNAISNVVQLCRNCHWELDHDQ